MLSGRVLGEVKRGRLDATHFPESRDTLELIVFLDASVMVVFVDQRSAFAARIYPTLPGSTGVLVGSEGAGATIESLTVKQIRRP